MKCKRREFRKLIKALTVAEFDQSLDDFPEVRQQFTRGMDKNDKVNLKNSYLKSLLILERNTNNFCLGT